MFFFNFKTYHPYWETLYIIGTNQSIRHLIPRIEVEIALHIDLSIETEDDEVAVRGFFDHGSMPDLKVSSTRRSFRDNRKVYVLLEEVRALKLQKATHITIG